MLPVVSTLLGRIEGTLQIQKLRDSNLGRFDRHFEELGKIF